MCHEPINRETGTRGTRIQFVIVRISIDMLSSLKTIYILPLLPLKCLQLGTQGKRLHRHALLRTYLGLVTTYRLFGMTCITKR